MKRKKENGFSRNKNLKQKKKSEIIFFDKTEKGRKMEKMQKKFWSKIKEEYLKTQIFLVEEGIQVFCFSKKKYEAIFIFETKIQSNFYYSTKKDYKAIFIFRKKD